MVERNEFAHTTHNKTEGDFISWKPKKRNTWMGKKTNKDTQIQRIFWEDVMLSVWLVFGQVVVVGVLVRIEGVLSLIYLVGIGIGA